MLEIAPEPWVPPVSALTPFAVPRPVVLAEESAVKRWFFVVLAVLVVLGFMRLAWGYWTGAHAGVDQNGYLVGGKLMAAHGSPKIDMVNPVTGEKDLQQFVARMWVGVDAGTPAERYYPKYPLGLPLLVAAAEKVGAFMDTWRHEPYAMWGTTLTYWINPVAIALAVAATFLMARALAGSFIGLMAAITFAVGPVTLAHMNNSNSHATSVCAAAWGMYLLIRWWQAGGIWRASLAGLILGYATTIRYTEGAMLLPLVILALAKVIPSTFRAIFPKEGCARFPLPRLYLEAGALAVWWIIPVGLLVAFNLKAMGSWTGYDPTNESTGFSWEYFLQNWEPMLRQINDLGLFFIFPLGVAGMIGMLFWRWQVGVAMLTWILPSLAIYTFYYWAPDVGNTGFRVGYLRFFLAIFPGLVVCAFWLIGQLGRINLRALTTSQHLGAAIGFGLIWAAVIFFVNPASWVVGDDHHWAYRIPETLASLGVFAVLVLVGRLLDGRFLPRALGMGAALAAGAVCAISFAEGWQTSSASLDSEQRRDTLHAINTHEILQRAPKGSVIFTDTGARDFLNHLQFAGDDYLIYSAELFDSASVLRAASTAGRRVSDTDPDPMDRSRGKGLSAMLAKTTQSDLLRKERRIVLSALESGRSVFFLSQRDSTVPSQTVRSLNYAGGYRPQDQLFCQTVAAWTYTIPPDPPKEAKAATVKGRGGGGRGGPGGGGPGMLAMGGRGGGDRTGQGFQLVKVTRKTTAPSPSVTLTPATAPSAALTPATAPTSRPEAALPTSRAETTAPASRPATAAPTSRPATATWRWPGSRTGRTSPAGAAPAATSRPIVAASRPATLPASRLSAPPEK